MAKTIPEIGYCTSVGLSKIELLLLYIFSFKISTA